MTAHNFSLAQDVQKAAIVTFVLKDGNSSFLNLKFNLNYIFIHDVKIHNNFTGICQSVHQGFDIFDENCFLHVCSLPISIE